MKKRKEYLFYCYNCPGNGEYFHNGYTYSFGEDYRNAKRYKDYLDCGFNAVQARGDEKGSAFHGGEFAGSNTEKVFKEFLKAGGKKVIVTDSRFDHWIRDERDIVGEGKLFKTEAELDEAVKACVKPYCKQKGFYGIQLFDEPKYSQFPAYGQLARSLSRVLPGVYLQCNLLPLSSRVDLFLSDSELQNKEDDPLLKIATDSVPTTKFDIYKKYVNDFLDATQIDNVLFDEYPFRREYIISGSALANYQLVAEICKERDLEFRVVLQSFVHYWNGALHNRYLTESDMYWQTNMALGFGVKEFSFYTYLAKPHFDYKAGHGEADGGAFINLDGSKTALYFYTKRIIAEMKKFSKVALGYSYENSWAVAGKGQTLEDFDWVKFAYVKQECPFAVDVDKGVALITAQAGIENKQNKLYMIENFSNVKDELFDGVAPMQVRVTLPKGKKKFYFRGKKIRVKTDENGKYLLSLKVGDAVFVEIK